MAPDPSPGLGGQPDLPPANPGTQPQVTPAALAHRSRRRWRWLAFALVLGVIAGAGTVTAEAWADHGAKRCAAAQRFAAEDGSWRTRAFAAASCQAWRHMHRRQHKFLTKLDRDH